MHTPATAVDARNRVIVAAVEPGDGRSGDLIVTRLRPNGAHDTSFGRGGEARIAIPGSGYHGVLAATVQADGKIVLAGFAQLRCCVAARFLVLRLTSAGRLDRTFAGNGMRRWSPRYSSWSRFEDVLVQPNGRILLAGTNDHNFNFTVARLRANGALDRSFGKRGHVIVPFRGHAVAQALGRWKKRIVVGGLVSHERFALARLTPKGRLDRSFGKGGLVTTPMETSWGIRDVAVRANGKIVAVGSRSFQIAIARYRRDGTLDRTFGEGGRLFTGFHQPGLSEAYGVLTERDGSIVVGGASTDTSSDWWRSMFALKRFRPGGAVDTTFGEGGLATAVMTVENDVALDLLRDRQGRYVLGGRADALGGVARFLD